MFSGVQVFKCSGVQVFKCSGVQVVECSCVQVVECSSDQVLRFSGILFNKLFSCDAVYLITVTLPVTGLLVSLVT